MAAETGITVRLYRRFRHKRMENPRVSVGLPHVHTPEGGVYTGRHTVYTRSCTRRHTRCCRP